MGLIPITVHGVDCMAETPEADCRVHTVLIGGTDEDAVRAFRREGWDNRDIGWLCPPCLGAYDCRTKTGAADA